MAQLKDTLIQGSARVTDTLYTPTVQVATILAPSASNSTAYSAGTNKQVLVSNGTSMYWSDSAGAASELATPRKLWGQSFDGTADVKGNLADAGPRLQLPSSQTTFSFLTSGAGAANGMFGRLGLYDSYSNADLSKYRLDVGGTSRFTGKTLITTESYTTSYGDLLEVRHRAEADTAWPIAIKNTYNANSFGWGTGIKLALGNEAETGKWVGIRAVSASNYANDTVMDFYANELDVLRLSNSDLSPLLAHDLNLGKNDKPWNLVYLRGYIYMKSLTQYPLDFFLYNKAGNQVGEMWYDHGATDTVTKGQFSFREFSPNSTASATTTGKYETYRLPAVQVGRADNGDYTILTTRDTVTVAQGGTSKTSWTQWGIVYASATNTLSQVAAGTNTAYANKYQVLASNGAAAPIWRTALIMDHDVPTLASQNITDANNLPDGVLRTTNSTENSAITNAPIKTCGGKYYTFGGYNNSDSSYKLQLFIGADFNRCFVRLQGSPDWGSWYRMPRISATVSTAIGGTKQPVYVNTNGEIVAGTAIKALGYKDSLVAADIPDISGTYKTLNTSQFYGSENTSKFYSARAKPKGGDWAWTVFSAYKNDKTSVLSTYGHFGDANELTYAYLVVNSSDTNLVYNSVGTIRLYPATAASIAGGMRLATPKLTVGQYSAQTDGEAVYVDGTSTFTEALKVVSGGIWVQGGSDAGSNNTRMALTSGMPDKLPYNKSKRGVFIYSNAIAFADPYNGNANNDAGWIRHIEETGNTGILEIGVGDDGSNEQIYVRKYNTSSEVYKEIKLFDASSNSSFPGQMSLLNTTDASSTSTGALMVHGGVGIAKKLYVGSSSLLGGQTTINYTTGASLNKQSGQLIIQSGTGSNAVAFELYRNSNVSWQFLNTSGNLQINNNFSGSDTTAQSTYKHNALTFNYQTLNAAFGGEVGLHNKLSYLSPQSVSWMDIVYNDTNKVLNFVFN